MTAQVPDAVRTAVRQELDALVAGARPEHLTWVRRYGASGARLVRQPDACWDHPGADAVRRDDGGWHVVVPLWTTDESPSDLCADVVVQPDGRAVLQDVRVP